MVNYTGLDIVGHLSIVVCIISMSPFVILFICSIPKLDPSRWFVLPETDAEIMTDDDDGAGFLPNPSFAGVHWRPLLNSLFWNLNSFDVGASFAGEVRDPERVFPRAMFLAVILTVLSYVIPLASGLGGMDSHQEDWNAGYFATVATTIGGSWLGIWTVFASAVSNIALFEAEMSGDAYQLMGMADRGLIPKLFTKRSRFDTPENGIILNTFVIILMSVADFEQLVEMLNFAYSLAFLMEFAAFIKLRIDEPDGKLIKLPSCLWLLDRFKFGMYSLGLHYLSYSRTTIQDPTQYLWMHSLDHPTLPLFDLSHADCVKNDLCVLRCNVYLGRGFSHFSKDCQALSSHPVCGGTTQAEQKDPNKRSNLTLARVRQEC